MFDSYARYYAVARAHGLTISPPEGPGLFTSGILLTGGIDGRRVSIARHIGRHPSVTFSALTAPDLDLGLSIRASGVVESLKELFGAVDVEVGDEAFDRAFAVRGDEPERVRTLLTAPLRAALLAVAASPIAIRDNGVSACHPIGALGASDDHAMIEDWLRAVVAIANQVDVARAAVPPAAPIAALVPGLEALAREKNMACAFDSPMRVVGTLGGLPTWIAAKRRKKGVFDVEMGVRFEHPLSFHFSVFTARTGASAWLMGEDVQVGEAEFDRAFDVHAAEPTRSLPLLDESCRASLLELGRGRMLRLDPTGLYLSDAADDFDPATVAAIVERMADLVKSLARRAHLPAPAGYR